LQPKKTPRTTTLEPDFDVETLQKEFYGLNNAKQKNKNKKAG
jgi:hypothetical protein